MTKLHACHAALTLLLAACASRPVDREDRVAFQTAQIISCNTTELTTGLKKGESVILEYTVTTTGQVDPQTIREHRNGIVHPSGGAVNTARQIAMSCVYKPATVNGVATPVTIRESFTIDVKP